VLPTLTCNSLSDEDMPEIMKSGAEVALKRASNTYRLDPSIRSDLEGCPSPEAKATSCHVGVRGNGQEWGNCSNR
jgi:hypothetical protein